MLGSQASICRAILLWRRAMVRARCPLGPADEEKESAPSRHRLALSRHRVSDNLLSASQSKHSSPGLSASTHDLAEKLQRTNQRTPTGTKCQRRKKPTRTEPKISRIHVDYRLLSKAGTRMPTGGRQRTMVAFVREIHQPASKQFKTQAQNRTSSNKQIS